MRWKAVIIGIVPLLGVYAVHAALMGLSWPAIWWDTVMHPRAVIDGKEVIRHFSLWPVVVIWFAFWLLLMFLLDRKALRSIFSNEEVTDAV